MKAPLVRRSAVAICLFLAGAFFSAPAFGAGSEKKDTRKKLVMLIAEQEYETAATLPFFAAAYLAPDFRVVILQGSLAPGENTFDRIEEMADADVLLVSVRRRLMPPAHLGLIRRHVAAGKPVVGIRTASHAFSPARNQQVPAGSSAWPEWDAEVMGGNYTGHHSATLHPKITAARAGHAILRGLTLPYTFESSLYKASPLRAGAQPILMGAIAGQPPEPVAWTFTHSGGGRTFYTSLGIVADFKQPGFNEFLRNAVQWAAGLK